MTLDEIPIISEEVLLVHEGDKARSLAECQKFVEKTLEYLREKNPYLRSFIGERARESLDPLSAISISILLLDLVNSQLEVNKLNKKYSEKNI